MLVESPISAIGPKISNQLNRFENNNSELIQTSCIKLVGGGGMVKADVVLSEGVTNRPGACGRCVEKSRETQDLCFFRDSVSLCSEELSKDSSGTPSPSVGEDTRLRRMMMPGS